MRILIISQYFWPENFRINDLVKELKSRGHNLTVLTGKPNYPNGDIYKKFLKNPIKYQSYNKTEIIRVPIIPRGRGNINLILNYLSFALSTSIFGLWKLRKKEFDVIFVFQPSPITVGLPAVFLKKFKKSKLFFWVLDLWPDTLGAVGNFKSKFFLDLIGILVSYIYKRCDVILVQSKSFIPQVYKYANKEKKVKYFPAWPEIQFNFKKTIFAHEILKKKDSFTVMFTGNIGEAQDFKSIVEAASILKFKKIKNIRLIIIGSGRKAAWLSNEIKIRQLHEYITMLGHYPLSRMPSFIKHADALLISLKDQKVFSMTIPGKLQTYFASGKPVVGMINGEAANAIKKSQSGLVCSAGRPDLLAALLLKLSKMGKEKLKLMGRNGLRYNHLEFNKDDLISKLEYMFKEITV